MRGRGWGRSKSEMERGSEGRIICQVSNFYLLPHSQAYSANFCALRSVHNLYIHLIFLCKLDILRVSAAARNIRFIYAFFMFFFAASNIMCALSSYTGTSSYINTTDLTQTFLPTGCAASQVLWLQSRLAHVDMEIFLHHHASRNIYYTYYFN